MNVTLVSRDNDVYPLCSGIVSKVTKETWTLMAAGPEQVPRAREVIQRTVHRTHRLSHTAEAMFLLRVGRQRKHQGNSGSPIRREHWNTFGGAHHPCGRPRSLRRLSGLRGLQNDQSGSTKDLDRNTSDEPGISFVNFHANRDDSCATRECLESLKTIGGGLSRANT